MKPIDKSLLLFGDGIMSSNMEKENVTEKKKTDNSKAGI